jgi:hypothetical protein
LNENHGVRTAIDGGLGATGGGGGGGPPQSTSRVTPGLHSAAALPACVSVARPQLNS